MIVPDENKIPRAVKNEWFYLFARVCMIVSVPVGSFFMHRLVDKADQIAMQVAEQSIEIRLLKSRIEYQMKADGEIIRDHETRLRIVERK